MSARSRRSSARSRRRRRAAPARSACARRGRPGRVHEDADAPGAVADEDRHVAAEHAGPDAAPYPVAIVVGGVQVPSALCVDPISPISGSPLDGRVGASERDLEAAGRCRDERLRAVEARPPAATEPGTPFATSFAGEVWNVSETMSAVHGLVSCSHVTTAVVPRMPIAGTVVPEARSLEIFVQPCRPTPRPAARRPVRPPPSLRLRAERA